MPLQSDGSNTAKMKGTLLHRYVLACDLKNDDQKNLNSEKKVGGNENSMSERWLSGKILCTFS